MTFFFFVFTKAVVLTRVAGKKEITWRARTPGTRNCAVANSSRLCCCQQLLVGRWLVEPLCFDIVWGPARWISEILQIKLPGDVTRVGRFFFTSDGKLITYPLIGLYFLTLLTWLIKFRHRDWLVMLLWVWVWWFTVYWKFGLMCHSLPSTSSLGFFSRRCLCSPLFHESLPVYISLCCSLSLCWFVCLRPRVLRLFPRSWCVPNLFLVVFWFVLRFVFLYLIFFLPLTFYCVCLLLLDGLWTLNFFISHWTSTYKSMQNVHYSPLIQM